MENHSNHSQTITDICSKYKNDQGRLLDILLDVEYIYSCIDKKSINLISNILNISEVDVEQTLTFYHFLHTEFSGEYTIHLNNSVTSQMNGFSEVMQAFEKHTGASRGQVSADGKFGLYETACIGMSDQEPAAIINGKIFPALNEQKVQSIIDFLKYGGSIEELASNDSGDGRNSDASLKSQVNNNIRRRSILLEEKNAVGEAISRLKELGPEGVISLIDESGIRGRGGAGFPTSRKWMFCRNAPGEQKYVFCNADEGEPGTFKDRVLLTEFPELVFEGMVVAGYAIGATMGILYIRHEYMYMKKHLEETLSNLRNKNYLGKSIAGIENFDFDIRIQFGAGAYVCGEESALIESAEGKRGEPRDRPPFPVQNGYKNMPTSVNNVETLCAAVKAIKYGPAHYREYGTDYSLGTKLISISGDCKRPGVYEVDWGVTVRDLLKLSGATDPMAVQVGGPSGICIDEDQYDRRICYDDLATGGSFIIIGKGRNLLGDIVINFMQFFADESCGACVPCRTLPTFLREKLEKILSGHGVKQDLIEIQEWAHILSLNRCGLGQFAGNPILTSLMSFPALYSQLIQTGREFDSGFDITEATREAARAAGRFPIYE